VGCISLGRCLMRFGGIGGGMSRIVRLRDVIFVVWGFRCGMDGVLGYARLGGLVSLGEMEERGVAEAE
jgi:hypothetical protein